jgi:hypothetical protein
MLGKLSNRTIKRLEENGRRANATVLEIASRGMTITHGNDAIVSNTKVVLKTRLRVEPDGEPAFEVEEKFRYSQFAIPSAGTVLPVIFDPDDHDKIMLDESPEAATRVGLSQVQGQLQQAGLSADQVGFISQLQQAAATGADRNQLREMAMQWSQQHGATVIDSSGAMQAMQGMPGVPAQPAESVADQLEKLADLRDRGVLTDTEFETQKAKLLSGS